MRRWLIRQLTKRLLVALTEEDVLMITNKGWFVKNHKLTPEEVSQLKDEVRGFKDSVLWKLMSNEIRLLANTQMFEKGISEKETMFGRAMLYNLQLLETFITRCTRL